MLGDGVIDLMDALGHDTINFEGESGQRWASTSARYPERLDKMVLNGFGRVSTTQTFSPTRRGDLFELSVAAVTDPTYGIRRRLEWLVEVPERIDDEMVAIRQRLPGS